MRRGRAFAATPALAQEVVKIGYTGPLSGGAALYGKNVLSGIRWPWTKINAQGLAVNGKKVKLEVVALDDKYAPAEAAASTPAVCAAAQDPGRLRAALGRHLRAAGLQRAGEVPGHGLLELRAAHHRRRQQADHPHPAGLSTGYIEPFIKAQMKRLRQERGAGAGRP